MSDIRELNQRRIEARRSIEIMGMMNRPIDPDAVLRAGAVYALAIDAWLATEREYSQAMGRLSAAELLAIAQPLPVGD